MHANPVILTLSEPFDTIARPLLLQAASFAVFMRNGEAG